MSCQIKKKFFPEGGVLKKVRKQYDPFQCKDFISVCFVAISTQSCSLGAKSPLSKLWFVTKLSLWTPTKPPCTCVCESVCVYLDVCVCVHVCSAL